jgi:hypothetical protein
MLRKAPRIDLDEKIGDSRDVLRPREIEEVMITFDTCVSADDSTDNEADIVCAAQIHCGAVNNTAPVAADGDLHVGSLELVTRISASQHFFAMPGGLPLDPQVFHPKQDLASCAHLAALGDENARHVSSHWRCDDRIGGNSIVEECLARPAPLSVEQQGRSLQITDRERVV